MVKASNPEPAGCIPDLTSGPTFLGQLSTAAVNDELARMP